MVHRKTTYDSSQSRMIRQNVKIHRKIYDSSRLRLHFLTFFPDRLEKNSGQISFAKAGKHNLQAFQIPKLVERRRVLLRPTN